MAGSTMPVYESGGRSWHMFRRLTVYQPYMESSDWEGLKVSALIEVAMWCWVSEGRLE